MHIDEFAYDLPGELIAQHPANPRDASRLLVDLDGSVEHHHTRDLASFVRPGDLLVVNDTRVLPGRIRFQRASGGAAEQTVEVSAHNVAFDQATLSAPAGQPFILKFTNNDPGITHNVAITDSTGAQVFKGEIFTGPDSRQYPIPALAAGTYTFACSVHPQMTGTLTVH